MNVLSMMLVLLTMGLSGLHYPFHIAAAPAAKIQYQEFVAVAGVDRDVLFRNAMNFTTRVQLVSDRSDRAQVQYKEGIVHKRGSFYVYKKGLLTPQIHGEIKYSLRLAVSEEGYTYTYTDFVFQYYEKNRYGRYEPVSGKKKSLEEEEFAGMQALWKEHKQTTRAHIENHIRVLKAHMQQVPPGAGVYEPHVVEEKN